MAEAKRNRIHWLVLGSLCLSAHTAAYAQSSPAQSDPGPISPTALRADSVSSIRFSRRPPHRFAFDPARRRHTRPAQPGHRRRDPHQHIQERRLPLSLARCRHLHARRRRGQSRPRPPRRDSRHRRRRIPRAGRDELRSCSSRFASGHSASTNFCAAIPATPCPKHNQPPTHRISQRKTTQPSSTKSLGASNRPQPFRCRYAFHTNSATIRLTAQGVHANFSASRRSDCHRVACHHSVQLPNNNSSFTRHCCVAVCSSGTIRATTRTTRDSGLRLPQRAALETQSATMQLALSIAPQRPFQLKAAATSVLAATAALPASIVQAALLNPLPVAATISAAKPPDPVTPAVATTITAAQLQALPASGRRWQEFLLDTPAAGASADGSQPSYRGSQQSAGITVDGVNTRLAFGVSAGSQVRLLRR